VLEQQIPELSGRELLEHLGRNLGDQRQRRDAPLNGGNPTADSVILTVEMNVYSLIVLQSSQGRRIPSV